MQHFLGITLHNEILNKPIQIAFGLESELFRPPAIIYGKVDGYCTIIFSKCWWSFAMIFRRYTPLLN